MKNYVTIASKAGPVNVSKSKVIEIPPAYKDEVYDLCEKQLNQPLTVGELYEIEADFLSLSITDNQSLAWLNYLNNVESISLVIQTDDISAFKKVTKLSGVTSLSITTFKQITLTKENFAFLNLSPDIKDLTLYGLSIEPGFLEELTNLTSLRLANEDMLSISNIDFSKLTFLEELDFPMNSPCDIAKSLSKTAYDILNASGVKIFSSPTEDLTENYSN